MTTPPSPAAVPALLRAATARLAAAGVATPRVDAELLLAAAVGVPRARLPLLEEVPPAAVARFEQWVGRRADREPLQHVTGAAPFRHLDLAVGRGVFVPRPETELLVDAVLPHLRAGAVVVDLCAGSGALALAVADESPGTAVHAVERSSAALAMLERNVDRLGAAGRVTVVAGDVADGTLLSYLRGRVDVVMSNPPYVPAATPVSPEVRADPATAVFAGTDGLDVIPHVLARAAELLRPGGVLAVEHDDSHGEAVPALLAAAGCWCDIADRADLTGRPRFTTAVRG